MIIILGARHPVLIDKKNMILLFDNSNDKWNMVRIIRFS